MHIVRLRKIVIYMILKRTSDQGSELKRKAKRERQFIPNPASDAQETKAFFSRKSSSGLVQDNIVQRQIIQAISNPTTVAIITLINN